MNNKIKVIDLLNKIANGEEIPEKINYKGTLYSYTKDIDYESENGSFLFDNSICICYEDLNDEIEIIEEPQEHKIPEKLKYILHCDNTAEIPSNEMLMNKINEIIDCLEKINKEDK